MLLAVAPLSLRKLLGVCGWLKVVLCHSSLRAPWLTEWPKAIPSPHSPQCWQQSSVGVQNSHTFTSPNNCQEPMTLCPATPPFHSARYGSLPHDMKLNKLEWEIMVQHSRQSHYAGSKWASVIFYCHRKIAWRNELCSWGTVWRSIEWGREHSKRKPSTKARRRERVFYPCSVS